MDNKWNFEGTETNLKVLGYEEIFICNGQTNYQELSKKISHSK